MTQRYKRIKARDKIIFFDRNSIAARLQNQVNFMSIKMIFCNGIQQLGSYIESNHDVTVFFAYALYSYHNG